MIGKCSTFGGFDDAGMLKDSGLAFYEPWEADIREDIFFPEDLGWLARHPEWVSLYPHRRQPTWARLRTYFYYIALRYDTTDTREVIQNTPFRLTNTKNANWAIAFLVDRGPAEDTGRIVDCSPGLLKKIGAETDGILEIKKLNI